MTLPLWRRLPLVRSRPVTLPIEACGTTLSVTVSDHSEIKVLEEILLDGEYDLSRLPAARPPHVIVDLGSNVGASILFFRTRFPAADIYGIEPDPATFAKLTHNVSGLPGIALRQLAIAPTDGETVLFTGTSSSIYSSVTRTRSWQSPVAVQARRLDTLIDELGVDAIDLLKIDIEGPEFEVLRSFDRLDRVTAIVGEVHTHLNERSLQDFYSLLDGFEVRTKHGRPNKFSAVRRSEA